ncbi:MAG: DNA polymerase III subunit epsilon [Pseudomonadota bacterium]
MREIVLDTETTGLDPASGHRVVEIGCVELVNLVPTGRVYHQYVDPERDMPEEAFAVHGLSQAFLAGHPPWRDVVEPFLDFIADDRLVIHNAPFDMKFLNAELKNGGKPVLPMDRVVDTLAMARRLFPGAQASLDALCRRFGVDNGMRQTHGALLDSQLLADVYLELKGGRQPDLVMAPNASASGAPRAAAQREASPTAYARAPRRRSPTVAEAQAHDALLVTIPDPLWRRAG